MPTLYKKVCQKCGKTYEVEKHRIETSKFCSRLCHNRTNAKKNTKHPPKICVTCGKKFWGERISCSPECTPYPKGKRITRFCKHCNKKMSLQPSRKNRQFCSRKCKWNYQSKNGTIELVCEICKKEYTTAKFFAEATNGRKSRYCSKECQARAFSIKRMGEDNPLWVEKVKKVCPVCKKEFWVIPSNKSICCSDKCGHKRRSKIYRRENHWLWTGGKKHDYGPEWKRIAANIRKRDNWTCQACGIYSKGKNGPVRVLHVHHIKPLLEFESYEEANHPSNLISLCKSCHRPVEIGKIKLFHQ